MSAALFGTGVMPSVGKLPWFLALIFVTTVLVSCTPHRTAERAAPYEGATIQPIYVATPRKLDKTGPAFGRKRPRRINYFRVDVSVPPTHKVGHVEWPEGPPDARTDFVVTDAQVFSGSSAMLADLWRKMPGQETTVFVHGYNNTLSHAMFRFAQIRADFELTDPGLLFSWLSAGDPRGYAYDRDSVLFSRDDFENVLRDVTAVPGRKAFLVAHSMGAHLVMETLRQISLQGDRRLLSRISGVVLMSPDIDPEIFRRQAEAIGQLPQPFLVFVSQEDRALSLAGLITGRKPRLGKIDSAEQLAGLDVSVLDFTLLGDEEGSSHAVAVTSPAAITVLRGMINQAEAGGPGFEDYMVLREQSRPTAGPDGLEKHEP